MPSWYFPPSNGGRDQGIHDAGIETFKGDLEWYLARETIQNSIDARYDSQQPVSVTFERRKLKRSDVPGLDELADTFERCQDYWPDDPDATSFFQNAHKLATSSHVYVLRAGDSNTTGVPGADDDRSNGWYKLVKCSGASGKPAGSGGSYGIGKNAPFAASGMQTVLYSTKTTDESVAFLGLAVLVTHEQSGVKLQNVGWFGGPKGQSERNPKRVPKVFRRGKDEDQVGTDLLILGYRGDRHWQRRLVLSVLENFWPAIHREDLTVTVDGTAITKDTLPGLLTEHATAKGFHAHHYYRAYTQRTPTDETALPTLKKVATWFLVGDGLPCKVAMIRRTGMVIYNHQVRGTSVPYCGVFECRNRTGNDILQHMEPPAHDKWDRDRPPPHGSREAADELMKYLRDQVSALAPPVAAEVLSVDDTDQYFPDDGDTPDESFGKPADGDGGPEPPVRPAVVVVKKSSSGGGGGGGGDPNHFPGHAFLTDPVAGVYTLVVEPPAGVSGPLTLAVVAVGDDAAADPVRLASARLAGGRQLLLPKLGRIGPVPFAGRGTVRVQATLAVPDRLALRVTAWEGAAHGTE